MLDCRLVTERQHGSGRYALVQNMSGMQARIHLQEQKERLLKQQESVEQLNAEFHGVRRLLHRNSSNADTFLTKRRRSALPN